jgi:DNA polymerase (family 10)
MGAKLVISTDAHSVSQMELMKFGVFTARRGWIEAKDVINTLPLEGMMKELKRS